MTYVRNFEGFTPPARFGPDTSPWILARIEEAITPDDASAVTIEGPFALSPTITNPADPPSYNFSTTDAVLASGWYRVVYADADGIEQATPWQEYRDAPIYSPSVGDVAAILRARAVEVGGFRVETFTDETNPTAQQVQQLIGMYAPLVFARLGRLDDLHCTNADDLRSAARTVAAQRVALEVEASYWPEELEDVAAVETRRTLLTDDITALGESLTQCRASGDDGGDGGESTSRSDPAWRFPPATPLRF